MNNEDFCSYEIAQALKKAGFDWECAAYYHSGFSDEDESVLYKNNFIGDHNHSGNPRVYSAPTLAQAQKWLREAKDYIIMIYPNVDFYDCKWFFELWVKAKRISLEETATALVDYDTYESALSVGIEAALKLTEEESI